VLSCFIFIDLNDIILLTCSQSSIDGLFSFAAKKVVPMYLIMNGSLLRDLVRNNLNLSVAMLRFC